MQRLLTSEHYNTSDTTTMTSEHYNPSDTTTAYFWTLSHFWYNDYWLLNTITLLIQRLWLLNTITLLIPRLLTSEHYHTSDTTTTDFWTPYPFWCNDYWLRNAITLLIQRLWLLNTITLLIQRLHTSEHYNTSDTTTTDFWTL